MISFKLFDDKDFSNFQSNLLLESKILISKLFLFSNDNPITETDPKAFDLVLWLTNKPLRTALTPKASHISEDLYLSRLLRSKDLDSSILKDSLGFWILIFLIINL